MFAYLDPGTSTPGSPIDRAPWQVGQRILDIGCGNGLWLAAARRNTVQAVGLDLSGGMLGAARTTVSDAVPVVLGDAQALSFATGAFDGALAMHMLYHVTDLDAALTEMVRVMRPGGWALITTNSAVPTRVALLHHDAIEAATGERFDHILPPFTFDAESAPRLLAAFFETVAAAEHVAGFKVTTPEPLVTMLDSVRAPSRGDDRSGRPLGRGVRPRDQPRSGRDRQRRRLPIRAPHAVVPLPDPSLIPRPPERRPVRSEAPTRIPCGRGAVASAASDVGAPTGPAKHRRGDRRSAAGHEDPTSMGAYSASFGYPRQNRGRCSGGCRYSSAVGVVDRWSHQRVPGEKAHGTARKVMPPGRHATWRGAPPVWRPRLGASSGSGRPGPTRPSFDAAGDPDRCRCCP